MTFFKRLFGRRDRPAPEPMHGSPAAQTQAEQKATRERMEAEMAADRERTAATEIGPGSEPPADQDTGQGKKDDV
jgi:hypothetical protein